MKFITPSQNDNNKTSTFVPLFLYMDTFWHIFRGLGMQDLYDFVDDNPMVDMVDVAYTNNPYVISKQHKMTAINSAIEVGGAFQKVVTRSLVPSAY